MTYQPKIPGQLRSKCLSQDREADDPSVIYESGDQSQDKERFTLVMGQRLEHLMRNALRNSWSSTSAIVTPGIHPLTVVFTTASFSDYLTKICKRSLSMFLESLVPGQLKEARFTSLRNVIAVDVMNVLVIEALLLS